MNRWTDEQLSAIEAENCSVIVSAAAGSGKTSVLVERLIRIISDSEKQIPVEKMIVVTFTRDAAAEMKQRLAASLSQLSEKEPENRWLSRQISMLGCAAISTITSFCIDLLRSNICQLSFSSGFRIADDTEETIFKAQAYKITSEYFYRERREDMLKLRNNFCGTNDYQLETMIYDLYNCVSSVPFFELWLDEAAEKYESGTYEEEYGRFLKNDANACGSIFETALNAAERLNNERILEIVSSESQSFKNALKTLEEKDYRGFNKILSSIKYERFPNPKKDDDREIRSSIMECRDRYKKLIAELAKKSSVYYHAEEDMKKSREILKTVSDFLKIFAEELMKQKEDKNALGFDDAESLVLKLLAEVREDGTIEKTALAKELSEYYELIMVDEFQDSNNRQDMIFRLLSRGGSAEKYGSNLFFVGDVKQSIYRFRLANPDNFIKVLDISVPYEKGNSEISEIRLNKNFRSSDETINFVNYIFSRIMTGLCGDIDYNEKEYLYRGANFCKAKRDPVVLLFDKSDTSYENTEARLVALKISEMLKNRVPVSVNGGKDSRPCEMRDFCILMRNNKNMKIYSEELEKLGIISDCNAESGYLKAREISVLINLLKVTDNPLLDTPLMSVMLSPMFMFTPDEAAKIRLINKNAHIYVNLCEGIGANGDPPLFEKELLLKSRFLHRIIDSLRLHAGACTLQELIRKIYDNTDFMSVMQLYGNAERKKANLRMLLEYAGNYEKISDGGLSGFIRYIDSVMDSGGDFEMAPDTRGSRNAVSIKSMHKSKGLEFPFVFIVGTWTRFNTSDSSKPFQFSYEQGLGFKIQNPEKFERFPTLPYEVVNIRGKLSFVGEEMRLLYVAMTRAKERLFITMNCDESGAKKARFLAKTIYEQNGITPTVVSSVGSMADWLLMCLISHSGSAKLRDLFGICESFLYNGDLEIEYEQYDPESEPENDIKDLPNVREEASPEMMEKLEKMFLFDYDLSLSELTAKLSVSDVSKDDEEFETPLKRPAFARESKELTPAEKGTALHKFLQFADFNRLENNMESELKRLYETGYLTKKQMESIRKDDIDAFLNSELFKLIKSCLKVRREKKFLIAIDDLDLNGELGEEYKNTSGMLNGIVDMVLEFENYLILADYKTDRVSDVNTLSERYSDQLYLYKKALEKTETKPVVKTLIYSFYKKIEVEITDKKL